MANYWNHNLAYDFGMFEEEHRKSTSAVRSSRGTGRRPVEADRRRQVNRTAARPSRSERSSRSPRSSRAPERKPKVRRMKRRKSNFLRIAAGVVFGLAAVIMIASIIHGQVQLTELNQEIIDARTELAEKQSIYTQLEMKVDSSITTTAVEQYAKEVLNMLKATNSQKEFIALSTGDKAEVILKADKSLIERIIDAITSLWS